MRDVFDRRRPKFRIVAIPFPKRKVTRAVAAEELAILERTYPDAVTALEYRNPFELLIAVILSAQCTDARVNLTTPPCSRVSRRACARARRSRGRRGDRQIVRLLPE